MSNPSPSNPIQPLSVGNVVSAGVRIFRSNLTRFLGLSLIASLWFLVPFVLFIVSMLPVLILRVSGQNGASIGILFFIIGIALAVGSFIYACAKYAEISGRVSRLAFQELINKPETSSQARQVTTPRLWNFFFAGLLTLLIFFGVNIGVIIVTVFAAAIFGALVNISSAFTYAVIPLGIIGFLALLFFYIRLISRLLIVEVPIAIEENMDATTAISRSWNLTKGTVGRIQLVVIVAFAITLLVYIPTQVVSFLLPAPDPTNPALSGLLVLVILIISILSNALIMPFWQVIKAVIYYDLRARREGFGLQLRDQ
jgi:hypothetical protein